MAFKLDVKKGGGNYDERGRDRRAGFLELVRLGIRPANDPNILRSIAVVDATIRTETTHRPQLPSLQPTMATKPNFFGGPWITEGIGRIWPIFTGERGEYEIAAGHDPKLYLDSMERFANDGGMIPEQIWDWAQPNPIHLASARAPRSATHCHSRGAWPSSSASSSIAKSTASSSSPPSSARLNFAKK